MSKIWRCRRSIIALIGLIICGVGMFNGINTSTAIAVICGSIAGANSYEKRK